MQTKNIWNEVSRTVRRGAGSTPQPLKGIGQRDNRYVWLALRNGSWLIARLRLLDGRQSTVYEILQETGSGN
ncbi:unnamed protein product, partial [Mesorhabditis spiculigera]